MKTYQTEQRKILLDYFEKNLDMLFTIEELSNEVSGISKSAIYRNVNQLVEDGLLWRFQKDGSRKFQYQYVSNECENHLHIKCTVCGAVKHLDDDTSNLLQSKLADNDVFDLDIKKTTLLGSCKNCK